LYWVSDPVAAVGSRAPPYPLKNSDKIREPKTQNVGRRRGSLWARHAHADIADVRNGGQLATGERGGGIVLASQRVEAVMGRRTRVRRPWAKASSRLWTKACTSRRGGGSVGQWVVSRRLDGVHMMNDLDHSIQTSLMTGNEGSELLSKSTAR
ncbi:hypothetical protein ACLOJK_019729, partial [Asimina triloba]